MEKQIKQTPHHPKRSKRQKTRLRQMGRCVHNAAMPSLEIRNSVVNAGLSYNEAKNTPEIDIKKP